MLKHSRGIGRPLGADLVFEMTLSTPECSFPLIPRLHPDLVVGIAEVNLCEDSGPMESIEHFRYEWEGVTIFYCNFV